MQLLRRDTDLGAEAELFSVGEARACVHDDGRGVDLVREAARRVEIARQDRLGVPGPVVVDVRDRRVEIGCDRDRQLEVGVLPAVVVVGRRADVQRAALRFGVTDELDTFFVQHVGNAGHERVGHGRMHHERLGRVAHARALRLRVHDDLHRLVEVGRRVDVHVTIAVAVDDHRHLGVVADALNERGPTARDQAVDVVGELHHLGRGLVGGVLHEDDRILGQPVLDQRVAQHERDGDVRTERRRRPAQQRRVPRLDAQPGGVARDVGAVLVDDRHHPERHTRPHNLEPVRPAPAVEHFPDRIRERGDGAQPLRHRFQPGVGQAQPVERAVLHSARPRGLEVGVVGGPDLARALGQQVGGRQ